MPWFSPAPEDFAALDLGKSNPAGRLDLVSTYLLTSTVGGRAAWRDNLAGFGDDLQYTRPSLLHVTRRTRRFAG
jgi:hypothetical protein